MLFILKSFIHADQAAKIVHQFILHTNAFLYPVVERKK